MLKKDMGGFDLATQRASKDRAVVGNGNGFVFIVWVEGRAKWMRTHTNPNNQ